MATRNDYLLLEQKCLKHYQLALPYLRSKKGKQEFPKEMQARFGFYYFILKLYTELSEHSDITKIITDTDFNAKFFDKPDSDEGIDAVYVDEENNHIQLFNFKYRFPFKPEAVQSKDEALKSSKFFSVLLTQKNKLKGRMKEEASRIIELLNGNETWDISFYIVSNENNTLKIDDPNLEQLKEIYGVKIIGIGLNEIVEETSPRPRQIDATLLLPKDSIMTFKEDSLSSNISYIMTLPLVELIRITCNDESVRDLYNWEDGKILEKVKMEPQVLYDNVRGFMGKTKYNRNIEQSLDSEPKRFFFYNNGITIIADDISKEDTNMNTKVKFKIKNIQVLNGGQTLRTIHNYNTNNRANLTETLSTAQVLVKFLKVTSDELKGNIAEFTNSQNSISMRDLRSLRIEQIQLEEFLGNNGILYERKRGDVGTPKATYKTSLGLDLMGQILLSLEGFPEQVSNKKREIFAGYYNRLFAANTELLSQKTIDSIWAYREIESMYSESQYDETVQKNMYILYLCDYFKTKDYLKVINSFEKFLSKYSKIVPEDKRKAQSRYLIDSTFREELTNYCKENGFS